VRPGRALPLGAALIACVGCGSPERSAPAATPNVWHALRPATLERSEVGAARIGRFAYVVGGFERRTGATTSAVERYDLRRDRWKRVRSMPVALNHSTAVAYGGRLYVHGGYRGRRDLSSTTGALMRYDPKRDRWKRLRRSPTPRAAHAVAVIRGRLYAAGGANSSGSLNSMDVYDIRRDRWRRGRGFPGPARNHTTGAAVGTRFYVLAGRDQGNMRRVDVYDARTRRWRRGPDLLTARGGIASARVGRRIVVFGGEELGPGGKTIAPVEALDANGKRWRPLAPMRTPRHGLGGVSFGRRVYAFEGGPQPGFHFSNVTETLPVR
jgi:N-acetylneuraminic acid mutarotase